MTLVDPSREPAVEDAHIPVTEVAEQPPGPRSRSCRPRVVDHHRGIVADSGSPHRRDERVRIGQRMAATIVRRCGQFRTEIDELRGRDVPRLVTCSVATVLEGPPNVQDHGAATHLEQTVQFGS